MPKVSKSWCFTLNNYEDGDEKEIQAWEASHIVYGREEGESGTPHLQGYVTFRKSYRLSGVKKLLPRAHWEVAKAKEAAAKYCKKDGDYWEKDDRKQGQRTDWEKISTLAQARKFGTIAQDYPASFARYYKGIYALASAYDEPQGTHFPKEVYVRWGAPGTGKTRYFVEKYPNLLSMQCFNGFWTRYGGEEVVLFDDFDGSWCKRATLLQMLDRYKCFINQKGGQALWCPKIVCITSNTDPREWYSKDPSAVMRRIKECVKCGSFPESFPGNQMMEIEYSGLEFLKE